MGCLGSRRALRLHTAVATRTSTCAAASTLRRGEGRRQRGLPARPDVQALRGPRRLVASNTKGSCGPGPACSSAVCIPHRQPNPPPRLWLPIRPRSGPPALTPQPSPPAPVPATPASQAGPAPPEGLGTHCRPGRRGVNEPVRRGAGASSGLAGLCRSGETGAGGLFENNSKGAEGLGRALRGEAGRGGSHGGHPRHPPPKTCVHRSPPWARQPLRPPASTPSVQPPASCAAPTLGSGHVLLEGALSGAALPHAGSAVRGQHQAPPLACPSARDLTRDMGPAGPAGPTVVYTPRLKQCRHVCAPDTATRLRAQRRPGRTGSHASLGRASECRAARPQSPVLFARPRGVRGAHLCRAPSAAGTPPARCPTPPSLWTLRNRTGRCWGAQKAFSAGVSLKENATPTHSETRRHGSRAEQRA